MNFRHVQQNGGVGSHCREVAQVVFSTFSRSIYVVCGVGVGAAPLTIRYTVLPLDES
jgi:hypothetical protein